MNPLNYASLPASQRLQSSGIVLETECCWKWKDPCSPDDMAYGAYGEWTLVSRSIDHIDVECIPSPSMAEVWRELPYGASFQRLQTNYARDQKENVEFESDNPTDALINLLIHIKGLDTPK